MNKLFFLLFCFLCFNCDFSNEKTAKAVQVQVTTQEAEQPVSTPPTLDTTTHNLYSWIENYDYSTNLVNQIHPPKGYTRLAVAKNSFADWLRHLPLKPEGTAVHTFDGHLKNNQKVHTRVIDIDTGKRDLQQCADAVMRLKAEYHYSQEDWTAIHFNYTSGDKVSFEDWRKGRKPSVRGNRVIFSAYTGQTNNSYRNFKQYLQSIFSYAGTASLSKEMQSISIENMQIGDIFIQGGFPGHAVIVMDMAENQAGEKLFLLAQSYMPAQDMHILKNWEDTALSPWYKIDFGATLDTPEWDFKRTDLKRF